MKINCKHYHCLFFQLVANDIVIAGHIPVWKVALGLHIAGWILQFIGHGVFEGKLFIFLRSRGK
jgi:uncharacterized membrane protein YGL010W